MRLGLLYKKDDNSSFRDSGPVVQIHNKGTKCYVNSG
uniref:Uncharacterized protein n=1 Tax=Rhizophora mucronata TaxID=61149 RepID=A0A2P2QRR6_RHIMU